MSDTRITIMTEKQAREAYDKFLDDGHGRLRLYYFTFAGWLQHKNIHIKEESKL